jgi:adenine phosphoribosyltransferase
VDKLILIKGGNKMADRFYELQVAGCTRKLPIIPISPTLAIAGFVILGDVELVGNAAKELVKYVPEGTDYLVAAETKGIPLVHEMARLLGMKRYVVARKSIKAYMEHPLVVEDVSITTKGKQMLVLQDADIEMIKGKNVLLVDDVISTGGSMKALEELMNKAGAHIVGRQAILAEGDSIGRKDITVLANLPLFKPE